MRPKRPRSLKAMGGGPSAPSHKELPMDHPDEAHSCATTLVHGFFLWMGPLLWAHLAVVVQTVLGYHFGVGEFATHFRTYASWDWDVTGGTGFGPMAI